MDISKFQSFRNSDLFKNGLEITGPEKIGDLDTLKVQFDMLFSVLRDNTIGKVDKRLALDYYNNFHVKISYPTEIIIEGKFIIGKNNGDYEFNSYDCDDFILND